MRGWATALAILFTVPAAHADEEHPREKVPYPDAIIRRPLTLPQSLLEVGGKFSPTIVGPDGFEHFPLTPFGSYGITDAITLGIFTDDSFCFGARCVGRFTGDTKVFNDLSLDTKIRLVDESKLDEDLRLSVAFHGGVDAVSLTSPFAFGPRLGALARLRMKSFAVIADPSIYIGVTSRDREVNLTNSDASLSIPVNRDRLSIPLTAIYQVEPTFALFLRTGVNGDLTGYGFGNTWRLPLGVGASLTVDHTIDLFASFTFPELTGTSGVSHERLVFQIGAAFRFDLSKPPPPVEN